MSHRTCSFAGCDKPMRARSLCQSHYVQARRGNQLTPLKLHARGLTVQERIDASSETDASGCKVWTAGKSHGYGLIGGAGGSKLAHRVAYEQAKGPIPEGLVIDHICGNRACVNVDHLRPVTRADNSRYLTVPNPHNTSGYRGVSFSKEKGRWRAYGKLGQEFKHLGYYDNPEDAAEISRDWRIRNYELGEFPG